MPPIIVGSLFLLLWWNGQPAIQPDVNRFINTSETTSAFGTVDSPPG
jgi:hypothetical protein